MSKDAGQKSKRAARSKLSEGEDSIDRVTARRLPNGAYAIDWSVRLWDGRLVSKRSQGARVGDARARARAKAAELLSGSGSGGWRLGSDLGEYVRAVTVPAIEGSSLADRSKVRYVQVLGLVIGELKGHTIGSGLRYRAMVDALKQVGEKHGAATAKQARAVLSRWVIGELVNDEVLAGNPLVGVRLELGGAYRGKRVEGVGGVALSAEDHARVIEWLVSVDPAEGVSAPKRGMYSLADRVAVRRGAIDLTVLQASTGLRIGEALSLRWVDAADADGVLSFTVSAGASKTRRGRSVVVLVPEAAEHLRARRDAYRGLYVIGSPADGDKAWNRDNASKAVARLYVEMSEALEIPELKVVRSHVWRSTLNGLLIGRVPAEVRAAHFGHTVAVNRESYTDLSDVEIMKRAVGLDTGKTTG